MIASQFTIRLDCMSFFLLGQEKGIASNVLHSSVQCLSWSLVAQIHSQKKRTGVIAPKRFVQRLKKDNELFRSYMHQVGLSSC